MVVKPLKKIRIIGKRGTDEPFTIPMHKGQYLYIGAKDAENLLKVNEAYGALRRGEAKVGPVGQVKIVGRGGATGFKPFLLGGERCLCILADHLEHLRAVNEAYQELLQEKTS